VVLNRAMTVKEQLIQEIEQAPDFLLQEVLDFFLFIKLRLSQRSGSTSAHILTPKRRIRGSAKGQIWISPDFDEPLQDFKEYME
jgi:hypothetical protein